MENNLQAFLQRIYHHDTPLSDSSDSDSDDDSADIAAKLLDSDSD